MATVESNWDEIPSEYRFTAVDEDGELYAYKNKPVIEGDTWLAEGWLYIRQELPDEDWRESLRERPSAIPNKIQALVSANYNIREALARLMDAAICFDDTNEPVLASHTKLIIKDILGKLCGGGND